MSVPFAGRAGAMRRLATLLANLLGATKSPQSVPLSVDGSFRPASRPRSRAAASFTRSGLVHAQQPRSRAAGTKRPRSWHRKGTVLPIAAVSPESSDPRPKPTRCSRKSPRSRRRSWRCNPSCEARRSVFSDVHRAQRPVDGFVEEPVGLAAGAGEGNRSRFWKTRQPYSSSLRRPTVMPKLPLEARRRTRTKRITGKA